MQSQRRREKRIPDFDLQTGKKDPKMHTRLMLGKKFVLLDKSVIVRIELILIAISIHKLQE